MLNRSPLSLRTVAGLVVRLTFPALLLTACNADAQRPRSAAANEDWVTAENYRLTMPMLRKALTALYTPGARTECAEESGDPAAMSLAEMQALLDGCAPVRRAAAAQGISTREAALVWKALTVVSSRLATEEGAKASGKAAAPLPAGVLRDNVALVRQNEAELAKLSGESE